MLDEDQLAEEAKAAIASAAEARCSFCDKDRAACKRLISGLRGTFICDECAALCALICGDGENTGGAIADAASPAAEPITCNICGGVSPGDRPCEGCGSP